MIETIKSILITAGFWAIIIPAFVAIFIFSKTGNIPVLVEI
jgi:hypothetical protein